MLPEEKTREKYLSISVGIDEKGDSYDEVLCLELIEGSETTTIFQSDSLDGMSDLDFVTTLETVLDVAYRNSRTLNIPVIIDRDEMIEAMGGDECNPIYLKSLKKALREFRENLL